MLVSVFEGSREEEEEVNYGSSAKESENTQTSSAWSFVDYSNEVPRVTCET